MRERNCKSKIKFNFSSVFPIFRTPVLCFPGRREKKPEFTPPAQPGCLHRRPAQDPKSSPICLRGQWLARVQAGLRRLRWTRVLGRPGFLTQCHCWREIHTGDGILLHRLRPLVAVLSFIQSSGRSLGLSAFRLVIERSERAGTEIRRQAPLPDPGHHVFHARPQRNRQ